MKTKTPKKPIPMPEFPDRAADGVVVCAVLAGTKIRLVLDDVQSPDRAFPQRWKTSYFFARLGALNESRRADRESESDDPLKR